VVVVVVKVRMRAERKDQANQHKTRRILQGVRGNGKDRRKERKNQEEKERDLRKEYYVQKYTSSNIPSAEAILVNGIPLFLQIVDGDPILSEITDLPDMILKPPDRVSYLSKEYSFQSKDEINDYIQRARNETLDTLYYQKVKPIWQKYVDADKEHIAICAADTIFTYFQDILGMTHYLLFVGDNNTGKSNNLAVFQYLGYRPLFDTSITPANIYQFLGSIEECQGIILEDEIDNIDQQPEKMKLYKVGYKPGTKVTRTDTSFGRKQQSYWTYCFKAFTAERQHDSYRGKGFNERTFVVKCSTGNPRYDITEVVSPAGDAKYKLLFDELADTRKLLLVYRLLHYTDLILDVELNIKNRDKQLCKPLIRLFQNSKAVNEILESASKLLLEKKERKANTIDARLYSIILDLVADHSSLTLSSGLIWNKVKDEIEGSEIPNRPLSYQTTEYGAISQKRIVAILEDRFGADRKRDSDGKQRILVFNQDKLNKLFANYSVTDKIEIITTSSRTLQQQQQLQLESRTDASDASDTSKDNSDTIPDIHDNKKINNLAYLDKNSQETQNYYENILNETQHKEPGTAYNVSNMSDVSVPKEEEDIHKQSSNNSENILGVSNKNKGILEEFFHDDPSLPEHDLGSLLSDNWIKE
jgi:hypothetical protein